MVIRCIIRPDTAVTRYGPSLLGASFPTYRERRKTYWPTEKMKRVSVPMSMPYGYYVD
jgi:hypothetical protein